MAICRHLRHLVSKSETTLLQNHIINVTSIKMCCPLLSQFYHGLSDIIIHVLRISLQVPDFLSRHFPPPHRIPGRKALRNSSLPFLWKLHFLRPTSRAGGTGWTWVNACLPLAYFPIQVLKKCREAELRRKYPEDNRPLNSMKSDLPSKTSELASTCLVPSK